MTNCTALVILDDIFKKEENYKDKPLYTELAATYRKALEDADKYRWHDLRENPDDLPKENGWVYAWIKNKSISYGMDLYFYRNTMKFMDNRRRDVFQSYQVINIFKRTIYKDELCDRTDDVIAWKYIEPLAEGEEDEV